MNTLIRFPYLGLEFNPGKSFEIFGISITYYGVIIFLAFLAGALIAYAQAKKTHQNVDDYIDFTTCTILAAIAGARLYYCIFEWDYYGRHLTEIVTGIRNGGLAIYGGVIASVITLIVFCKVKKLNFWTMADTACLGLAMGQAIGRWGNFFNREAFGGYCNNFLAMQIPRSEALHVTDSLLQNTVMINGIPYVQVHPAFFYESLWCVALFAGLVIYKKHKKFRGELFALYAAGYGLGRAWIEGLRTDQLTLGGVAVSQVLSVLIVIAAAAFIIYNRVALKKVRTVVTEDSES